MSDQKDGWRTIESAPKDGTRVLVWSGEAYIARWLDGDDNWDGRWVVFNPDDSYYSVTLHEDSGSAPTHWMPLPPPPGDDT